MEQVSGQSPIENLEEFLVKSGIESTSMSFDMIFKGLKYDWETNLGKDEPKSLDEFLKTTIYNASAKRIGIKHQANDPQSGQPGLEIEIKPEDVEDGFYIEIYHWESKTGTPPESINSRIVILTGNPFQEGEKFSDYAKRLASENKATFQEVDGDGENHRVFESPLQGMSDFKAVVEMDGKKTEKGYGVKEISLDIKIPYELVSSWLTPKPNQIS